jgi:hypothetical protein
LFETCANNVRLHKKYWQWEISRANGEQTKIPCLPCYSPTSWFFAHFFVVMYAYVCTSGVKPWLNTILYKMTVIFFKQHPNYYYGFESKLASVHGNCRSAWMSAHLMFFACIWMVLWKFINIFLHLIMHSNKK